MDARHDPRARRRRRSTRSKRAPSPRRERGDRGATLVEAAFVTPVFVLMIFAIVEFSGYVMARTSANAAVKAGARAAVVWGDDPFADREILKRAAKEGSGLVTDNDVIEELWIWHAAGPNDNPPAVCNTASECNRYPAPNQTGGAFHRAQLPSLAESGGTTLDTTVTDCFFGSGAGLGDNGNCSDAITRLDGGWPTGDRRVLEADPDRNCPTGSTDPRCASTDYVGIWMKVRHDYWTGLFGDSVTFEAQSVAKIESQDYDRAST